MLPWAWTLAIGLFLGIPRTGDSLVVTGIVVPYGDSVVLWFEPGELSGACMSLLAHIPWRYLGGAQRILRIELNGQPLGMERLTNKGNFIRYRDGRRFPWYDPRLKAFQLFYSPDLEANKRDSSSRYFVYNPHPYLYQFDLSGLVDPLGGNRLVIRHIGPLLREELGPYHVIVRQTRIHIPLLLIRPCPAPPL